MFAIRKVGGKDFDIWSTPDRPLGSYEAVVAINGVDHPLTTELIRNKWGYTVPIRLGDRVDVQLRARQGADPEIRAVLLSVIFLGEKEDHPAFDWSISEDMNKLGQWIGVGLSFLGLVFLILARRGGDPMAPSGPAAPS